MWYNFSMDIFSELANRQYKDRLFKAIFENREYLLSLYNAVNGSSYTDSSALYVNTIEDSVYVGMKNDLSFIFQSELSLYEQQSSFNPNMPLRGLMYFARLYEKILTERHKDVFNRSIVKIPTPKYVVFYNGKTDKPDVLDLKLSDAFEIPDKSGKFEWTATMLNINKGHNRDLLSQCNALWAYSEYVAKVRENVKNKMTRDAAIDAAINWAVKEDLLNGFFKVKKSEVKAMSITEFDLDEFLRNRWEEGREEGREEGLEQGLEQGRRNMIAAMDRQELPIETIAAVAGISIEEVAKIIESERVSVASMQTSR